MNKPWIRARLRELGHTQKELAAELGVNSVAVSRILVGKRRLTIQEAASMASFLEVPLSELVPHVVSPAEGRSF